VSIVNVAILIDLRLDKNSKNEGIERIYIYIRLECANICRLFARFEACRLHGSAVL
jgi:rRNA maturation endonuclease Nob1